MGMKTPKQIARHYLDGVLGNAPSERMDALDSDDYAQLLDMVSAAIEADRAQRGVPTEAEWRASEEARLGIDPEAGEYATDEDWENLRPVLVMWGDPSETPSERCHRLNEEVIAMGRERSELRERALEALDALRAVQIAHARRVLRRLAAIG